MKKNFYEELEAFTDFNEFHNLKYYKSLPADWIIFVADIKNSTKAIEMGKYKEVNFIGSAVISVCIKAMNNIAFPFVFGGDGASLCIPPSCVDVIQNKLSQLKTLSLKNYGLELRVSRVPLSDISGEIQVAKYELTKGRCIAFFSGGGLDNADFLGKKYHDKYKVDASNDKILLDGLTCRWQAIPSKRGVILSLLVRSKSNDTTIYENVSNAINKITENSYNPVNSTLMNYKGFYKGLVDEIKTEPTLWSKSFIIRFIQYIICNFAFRLKLSPFFNQQSYVESFSTHSDYRKFDDTLRLIIDCSNKQKNEIRTYLNTLSNELFYGIHESDSALMTCFVEGLEQGEHIHFIDGNDGGYAMAAKELKEQMAR